MPAPAMNSTPILLVEDEPDSVFFFQHAAEKVELTNPVRVAKDGQEALDYLEGSGEFGDREKHPLPGLVILDLKLPRATGFEVLRRVRANTGLRKLIVVILTSSASDDDIDKAYALGVNAYLVKPLQLADLITIVQAVKTFWLTHNHPPPLAGA
jgi:CheY-like chemotaxis protein